MPFLDSIRATIHLREQITKIEPQPVIARDNVTMEVDAVIYCLIADPVRSAVLAADGQARLRVVQAEAQAIRVIAQALGALGNPAQYLTAQRYLESLSTVATDAQKLVFLPYEASGVMASLGGIRELLQTTAAPARQVGSRRPLIPRLQLLQHRAQRLVGTAEMIDRLCR